MWHPLHIVYAYISGLNTGHSDYLCSNRRVLLNPFTKGTCVECSWDACLLRPTGNGFVEVATTHISNIPSCLCTHQYALRIVDFCLAVFHVLAGTHDLTPAGLLMCAPNSSQSNTRAGGVHQIVHIATPELSCERNMI